MIIQGKLFDKGSSAFVEATLEFEGFNYHLQTPSGLSKRGSVTDINVSDRLGNIERKLTFDNGSVFATPDNNGVDNYFKSALKKNNFIHTIESNLPFVVLSIALIVVASFSFFKWGVPAASSAIATALPQKTNDVIGSQTLTFLDEYIFNESELSQNRQDQIRQHFVKTLSPIESANSQLSFNLHFRVWKSGELSIPNALALPSGDIILTDKFVELSENQEEIDSVLLHEMGHIAHRHGLKMVIQSALVTTVVTMATGDINGVADLGVGIGSLLISTNYSRTFESEADKYAFEHMLKVDIDPESFANIMRRITLYTDDVGNIEKSSNSRRKSKSINDYFSTHPATEVRAQQAEQYSKCYEQKLKTCDISIDTQ